MVEAALLDAGMLADGVHGHGVIAELPVSSLAASINLSLASLTLPMAVHRSMGRSIVDHLVKFKGRQK